MRWPFMNVPLVEPKSLIFKSTLAEADDRVTTGDRSIANHEIVRLIAADCDGGFEVSNRGSRGGSAMALCGNVSWREKNRETANQSYGVSFGSKSTTMPTPVDNLGLLGPLTLQLLMGAIVGGENPCVSSPQLNLSVRTNVWN
jgi:hypothetical protein